MDEVGGAASLRRLLNGECCDSSSFFVVGAGGQGILKHISSKVRLQAFTFYKHLLITKQMHCKKWGGGYPQYLEKVISQTVALQAVHSKCPTNNPCYIIILISLMDKA